MKTLSKIITVGSIAILSSCSSGESYVTAHDSSGRSSDYRNWVIERDNGTTTTFQNYLGGITNQVYRDLRK